MKILISLFIALFLLSGCGSQKRVVIEQKKLPVWYENPTRTTLNTLYSIGEGENKKEAIINALNSIASTLSVYISSEFNTKSISKEGDIENYNSISTSEINSKVKKIRISNYEIINSKDFGFERYLVEIKVDKQKLFDSLNQELNQKFKIIESKYEDAQNYDAIKQLSIYKNSKESSAYMQNILLVMRGLNSDFNTDDYIKKLQKLDTKYEKLLSKISFSIASNDDAKVLETAIADGLSSKKYSINNSFDKNHFKIFISSSSVKTRAYGFDLLRSTIFISTKDNFGTIIGSNKINITGQSTGGYLVAKENVAIKLNAMIKKEGIENILGLSL